MVKPLEKEFEWFIANQDELVRKYRGKFVVIKDEVFVNAYDSELEAIEKTIADGHEAGTFLVQLCEPGLDSYTQTFHSRVSFS